MDSIIREINDNLKTIIDNLKENKDNSEAILENIQFEMDKKVEEAKKYKIQVDSAKEKIKMLEDENKSLELSLSELNDKYGKMNLVSIVEAGNKEIKAKINSNLKDINTEKEHIADLTNKARLIKDLLIDLKKDKTAKETKLEKLTIVYDFYNKRLNDVMDFALNHSENLSDYLNDEIGFQNDDNVTIEDSENIELENTMVFDEIANIDNNKTFKDEFTFISAQIEDKAFEESDSQESEDLSQNNLEFNKVIDEEETNLEIKSINSTDEYIYNDTEEPEENYEDKIVEDGFTFTQNSVNEENIDIKEIDDVFKTNDIEEETSEDVTFDEESTGDMFSINPFEEMIKEETVKDDLTSNNIFIDNNLFVPSQDDSELDIDFHVNEVDKEIDIDEENQNRISQINDLFANFDNDSSNVEPVINEVENKIDEAYLDVFGKSINEDDLNKKEPTLTDIFGNPISKEELSSDVIISKKIEDLFLDNGIDFNKFREDEQSYLKQIYDEEKFNNVLNVLKNNKINLDNIYNAFNIFGEINYKDLDILISKFLNAGQSIEAVGLILEKLPKVKKYDLDAAIMSYGDYVKDVDITELVMKAKELYKDGGNI